jgi:hypothetical protein
MSARDLFAIGLFGAGIIVATAIVAVHSALAQDATKDLLAAQIREQGFRCAKAISAHRDLNRSKPDEAVWVLKCEKNTYRLRLIPDMAARVKRLD